MSVRFSPEQARRAVIEEWARSLRLPRGDVSKSKSPSEACVESLMAVEWMQSFESRFGLDAPIGASVGGFDAMGLSARALASQTHDAETAMIDESLAKTHFDETECVEALQFLDVLRENGVDLAPGRSRQTVPAQ